MQNRVPEKRVGLALLLIGGFALLLYILNSSVTRQSDPATFLFLLFILLLGWGLRERFKNWGSPPPPKPAPKPAGGGGGAKPAPSGGLALPWGKKKPAAPPPPPKPAGPPPPGPKPKPKGMLGSVDEFFKPKNKK
jgi:hypothetical protein